MLARFPELKPGLAGLRKFIAGLDAYFNDHFGWRNGLIHLHRRLALGLFPEKNELSPGVIVGRNGWFFYKENGTIENDEGSRQFSPQDLQNWQALLEHRRDRLAQLGVKYIFVVAPDKESVYPEQLPGWLKKVQPVTKLDQFFAYMRTHSTVDVVDLRPALQAARQIAPTYYQTDIHWNYFGGFVASQEIIRHLAKQFPGLAPLSLASFKLENQPIPSSTLAAWAEADVNENCAVYLYPRRDLPRLELSAEPPGYVTSFVDFTKNSRASGSALVLCDSFGDGLAPFLGYHFGKVSYFHCLPLSETLIRQEKPDVVISEMLQKTFNVANPKGFDDSADRLLKRVLRSPPL